MSNKITGKEYPLVFLHKIISNTSLSAHPIAHGAISQVQHDKSLHDLIEKMGESE